MPVIALAAPYSITTATKGDTVSLIKRAHRYQTDTATIRSWRSQEGRYSLVEVHSQIDGRRYYLAVETLANGNQVILSRHRKRSAGVRAVEALSNGGLHAKTDDR